MRRGGLLLLALVALALPASSAAAEGDPGKTTEGTLVSNGVEYPYRYYTPASLRPRKAVPLVVMVHGCQTTAEQEQEITRYDALAERERFVVLYPEVDAASQTLPGPLNHCWRFFEPDSLQRGSGHAAAIADMTRAVMEQRKIDPERVYLAGISAGGLMTSINAAAYSDLYAAAAIMSSAGYMDQTCFTSGIGVPAALSAQQAYAAMGPRARIVPTFALGGDADMAFPWSCTAKALEQGLRTNNLTIGGGQNGPIPLTPASVDRRQEPGGREYTVRTYEDPKGCLVGESWQIHGMGHFWSGGTTDPEYDGYADAEGPEAAAATWAFFERYRKSDTELPCAEAPFCAEAKQRLAKAKRKLRKFRRADAPRRRIGATKRRIERARAAVRESC